MPFFGQRVLAVTRFNLAFNILVTTLTTSEWHCIPLLPQEFPEENMFPTPSYSNNPGYQNQEPNRDRTPFSHSYAQPFSVAGMTSQAASHSPSLRASTLSGTNTGSLAMGDSLSQSRVNYQPGYLMSVTQNNVSSTRVAAQQLSLTTSTEYLTRWTKI